MLEIPSQDELEVKALTMEWQQAVLTATHEDKRRIDEVMRARACLSSWLDGI